MSDEVVIKEEDNSASEDRTSSSEERADENNVYGVPDGGYGWFVVFAIFLFYFSSWGANAGFAVFLAHYLSDNTYANANKLDYAAIGGLSLGVGMGISPFTNYLVGLIGPRTVIMIGNVLSLAASIMASYAVNIWQLYLTQGVLISVGWGFMAIPGMGILPQWFKKKRALAQGLVTGGAGAGGIVFNLGMQKVMEVKSVGWALRAQGIIAFGLCFIGVCLTRSRADKVKPVFKIVDKSVYHCGGVWILVSYVLFTMLGYVVLLYNLPDFTVSIGYSAYSGSIASALINVGSFLGRPLIGIISDRCGAVTIGCICSLVTSILCLAMWIPTRNLAVEYVFAVIQGATMGAMFPVLTPIIARIVGLAKLTVCYAMLWFFLGCIAVVSPIVGIKIRKDAPPGTNYDPSQYTYVAVFVGLCFFCAFLSMFSLRGWILARDAKSEDVQDTDNTDQLSLTVTFPEWTKHVFRYEKVV